MWLSKIRDPESGNDVIAVTIAAVLVVLLAIRLRNTPTVRLELVVLLLVVLLWDVWAIFRLLEKAS